MKFQLITLLSLGLCFAAVVSAHYDDDSVDNDGQECLGEVMQCAYHVQQYQAPDPNQMAAKLRQAGLRAVCRDSTKAAECVLKVILNGKCNAIPEHTKKIFQKVFDFNNFLCVDKINDLENHWECLFNVALDQKLGACQNMNAGLDQCDTSTYMSCVEGTFSSSALCKPGAKELVREIINKMVQIMPHCSDHKIVHSAVMNFMKKK